MPHRPTAGAIESMRCLTLVGIGFGRRVDRFRSSSRPRAVRNPKKVRALFLVRRETRRHFGKIFAPDARPLGRRFDNAARADRAVRTFVAAISTGRCRAEAFAFLQAICRGFFIFIALRCDPTAHSRRSQSEGFGAGEAAFAAQRGVGAVNKVACSVLTLAKHVISFAQQQKLTCGKQWYENESSTIPHAV
jgi:hypothetical protein